MSAEKELLELKYKLDCNEYDDEEEFESAMEALYPDAVFEVAGRAAVEGAVAGMHLYGRMLARKAQQLKEAGEDYTAMLADARGWVIKAARGGCWGAMDDLATEQVELLEVPIELQVAYFKLSGSGGDLARHLDFLKQHCGVEVSDESVDKAIAIHDELARSGVSKQMCECIFP